MSRMRVFGVALPLLVGFAVCATDACAQQGDGITVTAIGTTSSPPDRIEMAVTIVGSAELAGEAATKYRGQRDRLTEALDSLGIDDLKTRPGTMTVSSGSGMTRNQYGQMVPDPNAGSFSVTEMVVIDLPVGENTLDTVAKIYDVGKDLGVTFVAPKGSGSLVEPRFLKSNEAEKAAYQSAMEQARKKADVLATLAGRELGQVSSVSVTNVAASHTPVSSTERMMATWVAAVGMEMGVEADVGQDVSLTRQKTTATLLVRFDLK